MRFSTHYRAPLRQLAVILSTALLATGCSSGPDIKQLTATSVPTKAGAPAARMQELLAAMDQQLADMQQAQTEIQLLMDLRTTSCSSDAGTEDKRSEINEAMLDDAVESAQSSYDDSKEAFEQALKILQEHHERASQITQKLTQ